MGKVNLFFLLGGSCIVAIAAIDSFAFFSKRGRLRTPDGACIHRTALHLHTVCSKLTAGETPASPVVFRFWCGLETAPPFLGALLFGGFWAAFFLVSFSCRFRVVFDFYSRLTRWAIDT